MSIRRHLIAGAFLATAAMASMAMAQGQNQQTPMMGWGMHGMMGYGMGPGMMGYGTGPGMMGYGMMGPGMMMSYGPMMQGQLTYLRAELGITEAQKATWDGYVDAIQARATTMQEMHATMMQAWQSGTALDRMDAHTKAMQSMLESMKAIRPATEALYKVLTDEQKKKADLLLGNGCCML